VTIFGLAFTPAFYAFVRKLGMRTPISVPQRLGSGDAK
jgi:hypothetical protein